MQLGYQGHRITASQVGRDGGELSLNREVVRAEKGVVGFGRSLLHVV